MMLRFASACFLFLFLAFTSFGQSPAKPPYYSANFKAIETGFVSIPDSVQTSVYWYWLSDNVTKEGVIKDLEAMKKVGINRAFIGNIGMGQEIPPGKAKLFSEEWWDVLHTALKTATRLNIDIGMFNSPGWSQSGGPWIKPEQAMRYLTSSEVKVTGPMLFNKKLAKPQAVFQDVKVVAYPVNNDYNSDISQLKPILTSVPAIDSLNNIIDQNNATAVHFAKDQQLTVDISTKSAYTARSVTIFTTNQTVRLEGEIQAKVNNEYITLKHFNIDRTNENVNVGFVPFGPAAISVPATTSTQFRLKFTNITGNSGISEIKLSATPMVENYIEKTLAKMWPTPHPFWDAYQWPVQPDAGSANVIDPAKVIDISKYMAADGTLNWKVPAGNWIIERTGMVPTNVTNSPATKEGVGLEVDKMSAAHITSHFNAFMGQIVKRIPAADRKSFKVVIADSYETGGQNWTDEIINEFKEKYKYDPTPYIPVLQGKVVGSQDVSDRFLWDLRRLIADDVSYKYVGGLTEVSHKHGLTTWLENYGHWGFLGEFLQYGSQADEVGGEFWAEGDAGDIENRAAASSAHIYGKIKVSAESFTSALNPFGRYPAMLKQRGDRFFAEGINNSLLHVYVSQPEEKLPGLSAWFGTEFNRLNTWFYDMDVFLQYLKRSNMMLQQGQYVADVAYFIGEDAPKMTGLVDPALPKGYSFDYMNGDVIKNRLTVNNGKLVLPNGISYNILVLPKLQAMRPELIVKIKELVQQGAVVLGPKPSRSPSLMGYPASDKHVQATAAELWGNIDGVSTKINHYGKGMVINGMNLQEALDMLKVTPDVKLAQDAPVLFIHRQLQDGSIYFLTNQKNEPVNISATFRVSGKKPELWNAVTGTTRALPDYQQTANTTAVPLQLAPNESVFVIFRENAANGDATKSNYPTPQTTIAINTPWTVNFDKAMHGPAKPVVFNTLTDWAVNANDSIKHYSGTAYYHNSFKLNKVEKGKSYFIDLGLAKVIAKVMVNGVELGGAWTPPYRVDITKALKKGTNKLEIKVVNTWVNRLVGDGRLPAGQKKLTSTNGSTPGNLESSGLLGPVKIEVVEY